MTVLALLWLAACEGPVKGTDFSNDDTDTAAQQEGAFLDVDETSIAFGSVIVGELYSAEVHLHNPGTEPVSVSSITIDPPFQVSPGSMTANAGTDPTITVYLQPVDFADVAGTLVIVTDVDGIGTIEIPVTADVVRDVDGDGHDALEAGGDDCDDDDGAVNPTAREEWYNGIDENCDGNDSDQDGDGWEWLREDDGPDCNDTNPEYYPGAPDEPYDNRDTNCDGSNDWDADGDGSGSAAYNKGFDCDDDDPLVNTDGNETFNGKDDDCDGDTDIAATVEYASYVYYADGRSDRTGFATAFGDFDDDGADDFVVGAPYNGGTGSGPGGVAIFFGGASPLPSGTQIDRSDSWIEGTGSTDLIGQFVASPGDIDGDGVDDLAIGAPSMTSNQGSVYVLSGPDALREDLRRASAQYTGSSSNYLGRGIGSDIDLDGDGLHELVILYASGGYNYAGVEYGGGLSSGGTTTFDAIFSTDGSEVAFYRNAPVGGDFDGDGRDDLVLSDGKSDAAATDGGAIWVMWGSATRYSGSASANSAGTRVANGTTSSDGVGWSTQMIEDRDADGDDELWTYTLDEGIYIIEGGADRRSAFGNPSTAHSGFLQWGSRTSDAELIRNTGDYTGDGIGDVFVFLEDDGGYGKMKMYSGDHTTTIDEDDAVSGEMSGTSDYGNGNAGYGAAPLPGDFDGDGKRDYGVGDPEYTSNAGEAYVFLNGS